MKVRFDECAGETQHGACPRVVFVRGITKPVSTCDCDCHKVSPLGPPTTWEGTMDIYGTIWARQE